MWLSLGAPARSSCVVFCPYGRHSEFTPFLPQGAGCAPAWHRLCGDPGGLVGCRGWQVPPDWRVQTRCVCQCLFSLRWEIPQACRVSPLEIRASPVSSEEFARWACEPCKHSECDCRWGPLKGWRVFLTSVSAHQGRSLVHCHRPSIRPGVLSHGKPQHFWSEAINKWGKC